MFMNWRNKLVLSLYVLPNFDLMQTHLVFSAGLFSKHVNEVEIQRLFRRLSQLISRPAIRNTLDHTTARSSGHHLIREEVEVQANRLEYVLEQLDQLQTQHVLTTVIAHFEDAALHVGLRLFLMISLTNKCNTGELIKSITGRTQNFIKINWIMILLYFHEI